jgi:hypothetical protein
MGEEKGRRAFKKLRFQMIANRMDWEYSAPRYSIPLNDSPAP